jgi:hypothetical protein
MLSEIHGNKHMHRVHKRNLITEEISKSQAAGKFSARLMELFISAALFTLSQLSSPKRNRRFMSLSKFKSQ